MDAWAWLWQMCTSWWSKAFLPYSIEIWFTKWWQYPDVNKKSRNDFIFAFLDFFPRLCCNLSMLMDWLCWKRRYSVALGRYRRTRHLVACCMLCEVNVWWHRLHGQPEQEVGLGPYWYSSNLNVSSDSN